MLFFSVFVAAQTKIDLGTQTKGTLPASAIPAASANSIGGVKAKDCSLLGSNYFIQKVNLDGTMTCIQASGGPGGSTDWDSITSKPTNFQADWNTTVINKPTLFDGTYSSLTGKPVLFDGAYASLSGAPTLGTLAAKNSVDYSTTEVTNKPTIPTALSALTDDATHRLATDTEKSTWNGKEAGGAVATHAALTTGVHGAGANSFIYSNDSRLTDSRTPTAHNQAETTITFTDVTTNNATTLLHGFLPKLGGGTTNFLREDGTWAAPTGGSGDVTDVNITTTAPLTGGTTCASGACSFTLDVNHDTAIWNAYQIQGVAVDSAAPTTNDVLTYNGSQWTHTAPAAATLASPWTTTHIIEQFSIAPNSLSGNYVGNGTIYALYQVGGTGTLVAGAPTTTLPASWKLGSGSTSGNASCMRGSYGSNIGLFPSGAVATPWSFEYRFALVDTANSSFYVGLMEGNALDVTTDVGTWMGATVTNTASAGTWAGRVVTFASGSFRVTNVPLSSAPTADTSAHILKLTWNGTTLTWFWDGVQKACMNTGGTSGCTAATGGFMPTVTYSPFTCAKTSTSAAKNIYNLAWVFDWPH